MIANSQFTLSSLIASEELFLTVEADSLEGVFDSLFVTQTQNGLRRKCIGIDGAVTAGKSFITKELAVYLRNHSLSPLVIHGDWFMFDRSVRKLEMQKAMHSDYDIAEYDVVACNFTAVDDILRKIHTFFRSGKESELLTLKGMYNRDTGLADASVDLELRHDMTLLFEGTGVLTRERRSFFDSAIRVDVGTYEETLARLELREQEKDVNQRLSATFLKRRYDLIDFRYDTYLRERDRGDFDFLVDTTDTSALKLYRRDRILSE